MGNKMSYIYAMSDIHGCFDAFEYALSLVDFSDDNKLILLGDYIHEPDSYGVFNKIMQLQNKYDSDKVTALIGNHEDMAVKEIAAAMDVSESAVEVPELSLSLDKDY